MVFLAAALVCGAELAVAAEEQAGEAVQPEGKTAVEDVQVQGDAEPIDSRRVMELRKKKVKGELTPGEQAYLDRAREERKQRARNRDSSQRETGKSRKQKGDVSAPGDVAAKPPGKNAGDAPAGKDASAKRMLRYAVDPAEIGPDAPYKGWVIPRLRWKEKHGTISGLEVAYMARMRLPMVASSYKSEEYGGEVIPFFIYLPPSYETAPERRFPVVYFLHGGTGNPSVGLWFSKTIEEAIKAGACPEMIIVTPQGRMLGMWADSVKHPGRRSAASVVKDLIPYVDATYRTIATREGRAIEGKSMGGFGAAHMGFKYPETFGAVSMFSSAMHRPEYLKAKRTHIFNGTFDGDMEYATAESPWTLPKTNLDRIRGRTQVRLYVGTNDSKVFTKNQDYHQMLEELGITHEYQEIQGAGHPWRRVFSKARDHCAFYWRAFGSLEESRGKVEKDGAHTSSSSAVLLNRVESIGLSPVP
jgi:enterochelin esterase-like enzyme